jgi:hypothetical protein
MLTLLFILNAGLLPPVVANPDLNVPEVRISIHPSSMSSYQLLKRKTPDTYTCEAIVTDADTHHTFVNAELVVLPGHTEKVSRQAGEYGLDFSVTVKDRQAEADVTVKRGAKVITRQRSTVYLNLYDGNVPLR